VAHPTLIKRTPRWKLRAPAEGESSSMPEIGGAELAVLLLAGVVSGWLAGLVTGGSGFGLMGNIAAALAGAIAGLYLLDLLGVDFGGLIGTAISAFLGAFLLLTIVGRIRR
jgi:uncharacterized membrane protein YeaQ/YmgE (transglycosylase-associated protein family)